MLRFEILSDLLDGLRLDVVAHLYGQLFVIALGSTLRSCLVQYLVDNARVMSLNAHELHCILIATPKLLFLNSVIFLLFIF